MTLPNCEELAKLKETLRICYELRDHCASLGIEDEADFYQQDIYRLLDQIKELKEGSE